MIYGYARCSTDEKKQDIARQVKELKAMGATEKTIYKEYVSGAAKHDTELEKVFDLMKEGDTLVATESSRLTRAPEHLLRIIDQAQKKRIKLIMGNHVIDCTNELNPFSKCVTIIMGAFDQLEREQTVARIKSGIANARAKGTVFGRPKMKYSNLPCDVIKYYKKYKGREINKSEFALLCKVTRQTINRYIAIIEAEAASGSPAAVKENENEN